MELAASDAFKEDRRLYVANNLGVPAIDNIDIEMPTPLPNKRTMGKWTLGDALGVGGQGRVFFASDQSADMAAIKVVERTSRNHRVVDEEIEILREVTNLVEALSEGERIVRMTEVIYSNGKDFSSKTVFDNVAIVLTPITPRTFGSLVGTRSKG